MSDVHAALAPNMRLTEEQLVRFKTDGILILYGLLDPDRMRAARERVWAAAPPGMDRADPTTWAGPFTAEQAAGSRKGFHGCTDPPGRFSSLSVLHITASFSGDFA
jgi:hypothetical protein